MIRSLARRAFRRPLRDEEATALVGVWEDSYARTGDFQSSIKDALLVVLTSPQFLFLIETSATPEPEPIDGYELASKLSYVLWNGPPDGQLLDRAARDALHEQLDDEITRLDALAEGPELLAFAVRADAGKVGAGA